MGATPSGGLLSIVSLQEVAGKRDKELTPVLLCCGQVNLDSTKKIFNTPDSP
jgi:hypothetical protein